MAAYPVAIERFITIIFFASQAFDYRHSVDWTCWIGFGGRIYHIISTNYYYYIGITHFIIGILHLNKFLVRNISFSK